MYKKINSYNLLTDSTLLNLLTEDNECAFTAIYQRYNKMLYVLAYKYIKNSFQAEDIVQQVFIKIWEYRKSLLSNMNLRNYLYTMTKNMVLNEIRNNELAMERNYELVQNSPEFEEKLISSLEDDYLREHLAKIMAELPEQKQKVCELKLFTDKSNKEIADFLGLSVPTVKTHYSIGIKHIRIRMQKLIFIILLSLIGQFL